MIYVEFFKCISNYSQLQQKWKNQLVKQQEIFERLNKCNCDFEFKELLLRKQKSENKYHIDCVGSSIKDYCHHSIQFMNEKDKFIDDLEKIKSCDDFNDILKEFK